jgi:mono/diheme cytochrome c family protein
MNNKRENCERRASGRVGVPPAVLRVPRSTRRTSTGELRALVVRVHSAGRGMRQAGRPPYPRPAVLLIATLLIAAQSLAAAEDAEALFVRRIAPLFSEKCLACHGKDEAKIKGGLDMRTRASLLKGGDSEKPALLAGRPEESPLYLAVTRKHDDWEPMPPKEADKLYAEQTGWIKDWIAGGALWPDDARAQAIAKANAQKWSAEDGIPVKTIGGLSPEWTNRKYKPEGLWAYQPVRKISPTEYWSNGVTKVPPESQHSITPALHHPAPPPHPIDAFIEAKIPAGLQPAPPADARTFIRRATFDLLGLPPTPEEVAAFETDSIRNPQSAIRNLIERLLASPHYGERMAQHWLDVVRYADTSGFANDYERGNAWRYRDYVVRSFNDDKRYDQFIREQIAGDELAESSQPSTLNSQLLIATGFLRMGPWELTGMEVAKVARQRFLDDVTNSVGETFLAHSLQCARCHDHKFDPIPTHDYYSVQAVFATTQLSERAAPFLPQENVTGFAEKGYLEARRTEYLATLRQLDAKLVRNAAGWFAEKGIPPVKWNAAIEQARTQTGTNRNGRRRAFSGVFDGARAILTKQGVPEDQFPPKLTGFAPEDYGNERVARKGLERLQWELDRYEPFALAVYDGRTPDVKAILAPVRMPANRMTEGELEDTCIHTGGDPFAQGAKVQPGVLSVLDSTIPQSEFRIPQSIEGRRAALASWVANPKNPLTTRAIVNRIWLWHFDQPIAGNPNNFGSTGKKPTHPELLDWLAATFVEKGWSFKELHRMIMTSEAYRRSSVISNQSSVISKNADLKPVPLNTESLITDYLLFKPRRLTAEELRDAMLSATGELNPTPGGIPNRPEMNLEAALQPRQVMGTFAAAWVPNPLPQQRHRRSIYALKIRGLPDPFLEVFNEPAPDFSCERREASTVTPQVFSLFNGQATHARALALANRAVKETHSDAQAIALCFALAFSRQPTEDELQTCLAHWRDIEALAGDAKPAPAKPPLEVRRDAVEENTGERFSFNEKLHAYADFVPDLQPADVPAHTRALADVCLALLNSNEFAYVY